MRKTRVLPGNPSGRRPGLGRLGFRVFHSLPNSAWDDGNLAEGAGQVGKLLEHEKQTSFKKLIVNFYT